MVGQARQLGVDGTENSSWKSMVEAVMLNVAAEPSADASGAWRL